MGTLKLEQNGQLTLVQTNQFADSSVFAFDIAGTADGFVPTAADEFLLINQDVSSDIFDSFESVNLDPSITLVPILGVNGLSLVAESTIL